MEKRVGKQVFKKGSMLFKGVRVRETVLNVLKLSEMERRTGKQKFEKGGHVE